MAVGEGWTQWPRGCCGPWPRGCSCPFLGHHWTDLRGASSGMGVSCPTESLTLDLDPDLKKIFESNTCSTMPILRLLKEEFIWNFDPFSRPIQICIIKKLESLCLLFINLSKNRDRNFSLSYRVVSPVGQWQLPVQSIQWDPDLSWVCCLPLLFQYKTNICIDI